MTCRVKPALVAELLSLEISSVVSGRRTALAFVASNLNDRRPETQTRLVSSLSVGGRMDPANPAASYLSLTWDQHVYQRPPLANTSCKAVFLSSVTAGRLELVESFADTLFSTTVSSPQWGTAN